MRKLASTKAIVEDGNHVGVNIRKGMDSKKTYYYRIEAVNENGISASSKVMKVD